jgi:hypothetical protein
VRLTFGCQLKGTKEGISIVIPAMWRAFDPICKLLDFRFPIRNGEKHEGFRNVLMPTRKLILLGALGVLWAVIVSAIAYYVAASLK